MRRAGYRVIGLDRTAALLAFARRRARALPLIRADLRCLPLRPGSIQGLWAAASLIHLPKAAVRDVMADLLDLVRPGGVLAATFAHGIRSRLVPGGWIPGRYFARWTKDELGRMLSAAGWRVIESRVVTGQERKGRWINVIARRSADRP